LATIRPAGTDAAVQKMLPAGFTIDAPAAGPNKGVNFTIVLIDYLTVQDPDGKPLQGNESKLTSQRPENFQQVLRVPRGALAASLDRSLVVDLTYQIEREVANDRHVLGAVAGAQA